MARRRRISHPGIAQHLIQRGNNRQVCFANEQDMLIYGQWLRDYSAEYGVAIHAWVFMTNHVHLLATPDGINSIGLMMQALGRQYVRYFNGRYRRTGTLWEGRYRSCLVDSAEYLLQCQRYIEMNPVRASMVAAPHDYRWSSYRTNAHGKPSQLVRPHPLYQQLGSTPEDRQVAYRALFAEQLPAELIEEISQATLSGLALGNERFKSQIESLTGQSVQPGKTGRPARQSKASGTDQRFILL
ncbi:transposase [Halopseudomonas pelagia]|uniref:transposase n=1 Tax=Halopseudomonas pelagia TaxID=553151 RepID=UPI0030DB8600|tara:strand:- start:252 stop:977 length:726 start_codon:yes stop_codon:yes gene_type:complete